MFNKIVWIIAISLFQIDSVNIFTTSFRSPKNFTKSVNAIQLLSAKTAKYHSFIICDKYLSLKNARSDF